MDKKLFQAVEKLSKELQEMKNHLTEFNICFLYPDGCHLSINRESTFLNKVALQKQYLGIEPDEFMNSYRLRLVKAIEDKEQEIRDL